MHHRYEQRVRFDGIKNICRIHHAEAINRDDSNLRTKRFQKTQGFHDGRMFHGGGDKMPPGSIREEDALESVVVGLGATARKDDLIVRAAEQVRYLGPCVIYGLTRGYSRPVGTGRVAICLLQVGDNGVAH